MAVRVAAANELDLDPPQTLQLVSPSPAPATPPGAHHRPAGTSPRHLLATAQSLQRRVLRCLHDELRALLSLRDHEPAIEQASTEVIARLATEVLHAHRQIVRARALAQPHGHAHDPRRKAIDADLQAALSAIGRCRASRRAFQPHAPDPRDTTTTQPTATCCTDLHKTLRTTTWLLARLTGARSSVPPAGLTQRLG
ncbi:MAG: hypothetical protein WD080_05180 [Egibacteraceae bacterium]